MLSPELYITVLAYTSILNPEAPQVRKYGTVGLFSAAQPGGGGGLPYETDGDAHRKIRIKPLKQTNLGVAQALFDP